VAALALTGQDLAEWRWTMDAVRRHERVEREVTHTCSQCKQEDRWIERFRFDELRDAAGFLERTLGKVGEGASLWFAKGGS
jgi:hypothetical protein